MFRCHLGSSIPQLIAFTKSCPPYTGLIRAKRNAYPAGLVVYMDCSATKWADHAADPVHPHEDADSLEHEFWITAIAQNEKGSIQDGLMSSWVDGLNR